MAEPRGNNYFWQMMIESNIPIPRVKRRIRRITPEMKAMEAGQSILLDKPTAAALVQWLIRNNRRAVQKNEGESIRVWRAA